jgi:hypothetical protein
MTQDQYGQARGSAVPGDVAPQNAAEEARTEEPKSMTRFQKVASALLGDKAADGDEADQDRLAADRPGGDTPAANPPYVTERDEAAMAGRPLPQEPGHARDYWDDPETAAGHEDGAVAVTSPDAPADHPATEPDMFRTTRRTGEEPAEVPAAAAESTGRHAADTAAPAADPNLRPGEATGALGDFSDLTYGNLVPDAEQYTAQWQQVQFRFVDDPHGSVTEAADIVAQVTAKMEAAIAERQRAIEERQHAIAEQQRSLRGRWGEGTNADTENMRETLRMYKTFLDQLIGSRTS